MVLSKLPQNAVIIHVNTMYILCKSLLQPLIIVCKHLQTHTLHMIMMNDFNCTGLFAVPLIWLLSYMTSIAQPTFFRRIEINQLETS